MSHFERAALVICLAAVFATAWIGENIFERMAHLEDEMAYVWQAELIAGGQIKIESPPCPECFLWPFVVDYNGYRFGKYPIAWPVVLAAGMKLGARDLVNPLLAALGVWLTYRLGRKLFSEWIGLLSAALLVTSPFFLLNSSSLLSHPWTLFLTLAFVLAWLDLMGDSLPAPRWLLIAVAGGSLGLLAISRPLTGVGVALPFVLHGLWMLWKGKKAQRWSVLGVGLITLAICVLHPVWQAALTGDPSLNPYTLWWSYDKIGFGPGVGVTKDGHNLDLAWLNTSFSLKIGLQDLFGWGTFSWIFIPFGLWAARKDGKTLLAASVLPALVGIYMLYWIGAWVFGPRYYYEGIYAAVILTAAGVGWLANLAIRKALPWTGLNMRTRLYRQVGVPAVLIGLVFLNLQFYLPPRLDLMRGFYGVSRAHVAPFLTPEAQALTPAIVIVHTEKQWIEYGTLIEMETPFLDTPFIFIKNRADERNQLVLDAFPERTVIHYYPSEPYRFYVVRRPGPGETPAE